MVNLRVNMYRLVLQLLTLFIIPFAAFSQSADEMKKIFAQAESYYLYEEFELANQLYLLLETPDNLNIKYKIGTCYLNIPGEKEKSIPYLEDAVKGASYDSKTELLKETKAPLDAYFFLAKAYMINDELEKGLATLTTFSKLASETKSKGGMQNLEYIDQQIQACKNAIQFKEKPVQFSKKSLGPDFNLGSINDNPAVSYDGNTIVYTERRGIVNVLYFSKKERGKWQPPIEITAELNAGEDCSSCSLNNDGTELFLYKTDNYDGAIYSSNYINGAWTPIKKLNKNINTKFYESHASISADGKKLYFTSNREGGQGNLDIYVSEKDASGDWGIPVNLGAAINTPFNEDTPFITANDSVLYFSSEGHSTMGGYDNFKSQRFGDVWKTPSNLGYPINSSDDDKFFEPVNNGVNAYYSITTDYKKNDIFFIGIGVNDVAQLFEIKGKFSLKDTTVTFDKNYAIHLLDNNSGDTLDVGFPNKYTGFYSFTVLPGDLKLIYTGKGYLSHTVDTTIQQDNPSLIINIDAILERDTTVKVAIVPDLTVYDKINLSLAPSVNAIDTSILITNMNVADVSDRNVDDADILYYTVQVIALHNPVDVSYFKYITDMKVMYSDTDKFYRYTTGRLSTREEAYALRLELIRKGYPEEIFIKKVSKE
ncbi:MAG: PD40 domain-containing protein [Bacteroidales bacterium]|nr:PD40 domain-containing protein [Bacteroidales bacterium]